MTIRHSFARGRELKSISVKNSGFFVFAQNGYSGAIEWDVQEYDTTNGAWHDPSFADSGTATGTHTATTLQDTTQTWTVNEYAGAYIRITGGTGINQRRRIVSNTVDTLTVTGNWATTVDNTSTYQIGFNNKITVDEDGLYEINIQLGSERGTDLRGILCQVNDAFAQYFLRFYVSLSANTEQAAPLTKILQLNAGDHITVQWYQSSGGDLRFVGGFGRTWVQVTKID